MANTKNIIQNIPLVGSLNMNTLKTDVKQFQGYNEKNTTVFGGTLSPIYAKEESLYSKTDSYTVYDQNGTPITLYAKSDGYVSLYKGTGSDTKVIESKGFIPFKREIKNLPTDCPWAATIVVSDTERLQFCYDLSNKYLKCRVSNSTVADEDINDKTWINQMYFGLEELDAITLDYDTVNKKGIICAVDIINTASESDVNPNFEAKVFLVDFTITDRIYLTFGTQVYTQVYITNKYTEFSPIISVFAETNEAYICTKSGKITGDDSSVIVIKLYKDDTGSWVTDSNSKVFKTQSSHFWYQSSAGKTSFSKTVTLGETGHFYDLNQYAVRDTQVLKNCMIKVVTDSSIEGTNYYNFLTGNDGTGYIPTILKSATRKPYQTGYWSKRCLSVGFETYYLNGQLLALSAFGMPIAPMASIESNNISVINNMLSITGKNVFTDTAMTINYKSNGKWYSVDFFRTTSIKVTDKSQLLKKMIINEDTIWLPYIDCDGIGTYFGVQEGRVYDINNGSYKKINTGYIATDYPFYLYRGTLTDNVIDGFTTTGAIFGGGYNAGYTVSGASNIGYLANPSLMTYVPVNATLPINDSNKDTDIQLYCTLGLTVQTATYVGTDSRYYGTVISIDSNGNLPLPIPFGSEVIPGYSNNDLVSVDGTVYPLIYYNNNQKINGFYLLSMLENMQGSFSLQGQSYVFDNDNIYAATFDSGIVGTVQEVAYKRNLQFIGTLPTRAIFYSKFNKSFYVFTGDRNLTKMIEASYIDEIYYVGQNPSTLSIWLCTDKGIYVMSDEDMYKLDFLSNRISFAPDYTILNTDDGSYNHEIRVALYEVQDNMTEIPVKLQTAYYGVSTEMKANMDCWYIRAFDANKKEGYITVQVNTITNTATEVEEKTFRIEPKDYDNNNTVYIRYQPKFQECVAMQLGLESNLGVYELALGLNSNDSTAQVSKFNF